jgi:DNA-directed RNA polymerase III subunit RPC6
MSSDEEMLYTYIQDAAREGIWSKTLKTKSNMHATTMTKCLKTLEQKRYVKVVQSVKVSRFPPPVVLGWEGGS